MLCCLWRTTTHDSRALGAMVILKTFVYYLLSGSISVIYYVVVTRA